jgi:hypothetical protein
MAAEIFTNLKVKSSESTGVDATILPVYLSNSANVSLSVTEHSGRLLVVPDMTSNNFSAILPTPTRSGDSYRFVLKGPSQMQTNYIVKASETGTLFTGSVTLFETRDAANLAVFADNTTSSNLMVVQPQAMDLLFVSANTSSYLVSGSVTATGQANGLSFQDRP